MSITVLESYLSCNLIAGICIDLYVTYHDGIAMVYRLKSLSNQVHRLLLLHIDVPPMLVSNYNY